MPDPIKANPNANNPLLSLAFELQVHWLTYLRAYDLGAMQQTCQYYSNPVLVDATVRKFQQLYDAKEEDLDAGGAAVTMTSPTAGKKKAIAKKSSIVSTMAMSNSVTRPPLTFRQLRFMEMRAVSRALQRPEPNQGYFVSKSWCKHALKWLETQQQDALSSPTNNNNKKVSKKKQRLQQRRLSDACPPWPNVNSDLLCPHNQMACSKARSAKRLDKQAWKLLKKLYPDSTQLATAVGECVQCSLERETELKRQMDLKEKEVKARKEPLQDPEIRRFYTRTRGVPLHKLRQDSERQSTSDDALVTVLCSLDLDDRKFPANGSPATLLCPLQDDTYFLLPRAWCHGWRRSIRTGQGECGPPHAGGILCQAHGTPLLPPHLELYLQGRAQTLLDSITTSAPIQQSTVQHARPSFIPGQGPDEATIQALRAAGLSNAEVNLQLAAMLSVEQQLQQQIRPPPAPAAPAVASSISKNELLDRENHVVVEILTLAEFTALELLYSGSSYGISFEVTNGRAVFETSPCRKCDATGRQCNITMRNRLLRNPRKGANSNPIPPSPGDGNKQARAGATLEY